MASHSEFADSISVCSTLSRSKAERLITFSTSGRRCLLLQRLGEVLRPGFDFREEARVLDGDHRLFGKALDQRDLCSS